MRARLLITCLATAALLGGMARLPANQPAKRQAADSDDKRWAFQPVKRPAVPMVRDRDWVRTPVDAFILAKLEQKGIKPAPAADRRTLLRRVYLDLIGLPPSPDEQHAFLADKRPDAYDRVVEDLLARPQYGERWARHWLDVARYAESNGYERDGAKPNAWRYRDYVIDAFNKDKPYNRFLTEQLAGDEMDGANAETQIATTFLRLGTWDDEPAEPVVDRYDQLDDVLGTTATAFMGVTLRCARCHDHKFDPFPQVDYYRMLSVFEPLKRPQRDRADLDRPVGNPAEVEVYQKAQAKIDAEVQAVQKQLAALNTAVRERILAGSEGKGTSLPPDAVAAFRAEPAKRTNPQKDLVKKYAELLAKEINKAATAEERGQRERLEKQIAGLNASRPGSLPRAYIWEEPSPKPPVTRVLLRGDPSRPKKAVSPGVPSVLADKQPEPPKPTAKTTGRRLWLARWLTSRDNPLVARVMVNRIWQHHFGRGIVGTPNDFGSMGEPPTHPELLDWLAAEFVARGWSVKAMHRLIVLSNTYQMANAFQAHAAKIDPKNALLWRWPQTRLQAEAVRDSMLAVSGQLNSQRGGPSVYPKLPKAVLAGQSRPGEGWGKSPPEQVNRRSIYIFVKRSLAVPELDLLDAPDTTSSCEQRPVSTTAPQALTFLNGEFANEQARHFAARLEREAGTDPKAQVARAYVLALCRPPTANELQASVEFLEKQQRQIEADTKQLSGARRPPEGNARRKALEAFCLVVLNTNEFVYLN
jgi:hypothetical protein